MEDAAQQAWLAFEEGRLEEADRLWSELIDSAETEEQRDRLVGHRAYVHVAQGRFDEARAAYRELLDRSGSHRHLHQLGMVEREAGNLEEALRIFDREAGRLPAGDELALAASLYERALVHLLLERGERSFEMMEQCVEVAARCDDLTMVAVAWRLKGDVLVRRDPAAARAAYERAINGFAKAEDELGMAEVERRIASLSSL